MYTDRTLLDRLRQIHNQIIEQNKMGGVSDMAAFKLYQEYVSDNVKELTDISEQQTFDGNINDCSIYKKNKKGQKKIGIENGKAYY